MLGKSLSLKEFKFILQNLEEQVGAGRKFLHLKQILIIKVGGSFLKVLIVKLLFWEFQFGCPTL